MKKVASFLLLAAICFSLCACDPGWYPVDRDELNDVVCVDLIEYQNPDQKHFTSWVPDHFKRLAPFISANAVVLETLPKENIPGFLDAFSNSDILDSYYVYNSPKDICIRLTYSDGDFLILWANYAQNSYAGYIGEYSSDGTVLSFWGSFCSLHDYQNLVDQHFTCGLP